MLGNIESRSEQPGMRWLVGKLNRHGLEQSQGDGEGQEAWGAAVHGVLFIWLHQVLVVAVAACTVFSCAMWNLVPWPGIEPGPPALGVQFSRSVVSNSLWPHGLQHARPSRPLPTPGVYSNLCPLSQWCHPTISSCHPLLLLPSVLPSIRVFSDESDVHIRWPKYWSFSFSISPSNEYSGLISFQIDWLDFLAVQGTLKSLL